MTDSGTGIDARTYSGPAIRYVTPDELAAQLAYRNTADPKLGVACDAATMAIDHRCGKREQFAEPVPAGIHMVALSLAVDVWKQADATFGVMGLSETGPVRTARDLCARYDDQLVPYYEPTGAWGIA